MLYTLEDNVLAGRVRGIEQITDKQIILTSRIAIPALPQAALEDFQQE